MRYQNKKKAEEIGMFACDLCVFRAHLWQQREDVNSDPTLDLSNNAHLGDMAAKALV